MGPHRIIHNHKGYLTETVYDETLGRFVERLWPPTLPAEATPQSATDSDPLPPALRTAAE